MAVDGLVFPFKELIDECMTLKSYASEVLDRTTVRLIDEAKGNLESIRAKAPTSRTSRWSISEASPLRTIWSMGESQPGDKSAHRVRGEFSFVWEVRPLDEGKWRGRRHFVLDGLASTRVRLVDQAGVCLAQWTTDIGDRNSPGTHFHFQFNGFDAPPFPKSLDIPRLPAPLLSPFIAIELAIGELFQDRWRKYAVSSERAVSTWRNIHMPRLKRYYRWQARCLERSQGSPWMALKLAKPQPDLAVTDAES